MDTGLGIQGRRHSQRHRTGHIFLSIDEPPGQSLGVQGHSLSFTEGTQFTHVGSMWTHRALNPPPHTHRDINRDILRLQDHNLLRCNGDMTPEGHSKAHRHPPWGRNRHSQTKCPSSAFQGQELEQGPWRGWGNADVVDRGLKKGRVGLLSCKEGRRVQAEQLGGKAAPGQYKPEERGGPRWVQRAGGRQGGESTEKA